jgi:hypothetical protein
VQATRKEVIRRRLDQEVYSSKKSLHRSSSQEAEDFESSLLKLAAFKKGNFSDFTQKDKYNLLDLFVNNEQTLTRIYDALFPQCYQGYQGVEDSQNSFTTKDAYGTGHGSGRDVHRITVHVDNSTNYYG